IPLSRNSASLVYETVYSSLWFVSFLLVLT
ncbi:putative membrane protein, partial [Chlamydia psittaci 06-1683]